MTPNKIMFIDLEVENNEYYGSKASPRHPDNYVVMLGVAIDESPYSGERVLTHYKSKEEARDWFKVPDDVWLIVAHNAPFELDWLLVQQREEVLKFLKRGGRFFCTAYAHYLLSNQQDTYPALNTIAPMYGGTQKVDGVKALWEQGYLTSQIDPDLLAEYLIGPNGDIENTRIVFYEQYQQLVERGMYKMAMERMEGMIFNCLAMDSGLKVDRKVAFAQLRKGEAELEALRQEFAKYREGLPAEAEFKETSDYHMSAWVYGGPLKYKARVPRTTAEGELIYEKVECYAFG